MLRRCGAHATVSGAVAAPGCGGDEAVAEALASADVEETYLAEIARKERRLPGRGQVCLLSSLSAAAARGRRQQL
uniref:Uncharacterized protein n=1 Tax=Setaria viridis TaxID=4556 RepID=A0A4U6TYU9_SETVI|nr:hypothetical protein SEVIR_6G012250v2 [Setaria viridis]